LDTDGKGYITKEQLIKAVGGISHVRRNKRLETLLWQVDRILDGEIRLADFEFLVKYTESTNM